MMHKIPCGSAYCGRLAEGCEHCIEGAKMVLFVTGRCECGCFYCPVSQERMGLDVIYANEGRVTTDDQIIAEAEAMEATGTGITGGDPLLDMERTLHMISLLKGRFGEGHHIHLYTATMDPAKARMLDSAGLDEIRFHPHSSLWSHMQDTPLAEIVGSVRMDVGIEVPALPGMEKELISLVQYADSVGVRFVNLNELEFSESNWSMMDAHGYEVKDEISSAVKGSEETALAVMKKCRRASVHFCSSSFKDGVQLRRRLIRRAMHIVEEYQQVTEDGTLVMGFLYADDPEAARRELVSMGVPEDMMSVHDTKLEVAPWILEDIAPRLKYRCFLSERYPTVDGLEIERTPLN
jgi:hypothetical protein